MVAIASEKVVRRSIPFMISLKRFDDAEYTLQSLFSRFLSCWPAGLITGTGGSFRIGLHVC